jgi:uncharacterized membrane protein
MDVVFSFDSPPLHALLVNFPVALLIVALLTALIWAANGMRFWRRVTLLLSGLGALTAAGSLFSGNLLKEQVEVTEAMSALIDLHETFAVYTVIAAMISTVFLAGFSFYLERRTTIERNPPDPAWIRSIGFVLVFAAAALCALSAHVGAVMVWSR